MKETKAEDPKTKAGHQDAQCNRPGQIPDSGEGKLEGTANRNSTSRTRRRRRLMFLSHQNSLAAHFHYIGRGRPLDLRLDPEIRHGRREVRRCARATFQCLAGRIRRTPFDDREWGKGAPCNRRDQVELRRDRWRWALAFHTTTGVYIWRRSLIFLHSATGLRRDVRDFRSHLLQSD
ncbi:uncharacterized protein LAESUDRAFT_464398 [Laetiporus sulphureus 93-53]|uniref:Uncharacterized protein n=1 Tax=Laetiporus sulphureus 93-53 TaxID=1314785 RepID=A0A165G6N3_9APHY|nr:uncharacterized protein LAESUDRAFT_464398 [Laetiporus sulphureus 93-53]KZT09900.1 hypothetical protein LAESUDRAFT_464398 [Laetiporus sulphureus 93-53]